MASTAKRSPRAPAKTAPKTVATIPGAIERGPMPQDSCVVTDLGLRVIERGAAEGLSTAAIARALGVTKQSFANLRQRDERVAEAYEVGRAMLEAEIFDLLMTAARGGNVVAAIFLSKTRLGWRETGADEAKAPNIVINLPGALSEEEWQRRREQSGATITVEQGDSNGPAMHGRHVSVTR